MKTWILNIFLVMAFALPVCSIAGLGIPWYLAFLPLLLLVVAFLAWVLLGFFLETAVRGQAGKHRKSNKRK